jgi:fatty acid desaturase
MAGVAETPASVPPTSDLPPGIEIPEDGPGTFSIREASRIVADLFTPNPVIYWTDLLVSAAVAYGTAAVVAFVPLPWWAVGALVVVSALAFYRAGSVTHELSHLRRKGFQGFRVAWNLLCGIPLTIPAFLYDEHRAHHGRHTYGTREDAEYLPLGAPPRQQIFIYLLQPFVAPLAGILRFGLIAPVSFLHPKLRHLVLERASALVMDPDYKRPVPPPKERWSWPWQEAATFVSLCVLFTLMYTGVLSWWFLVQLYFTALIALWINALRTMAAHRFRHPARTEIAYVDQMLDSVNIPGNMLTTELWAPLGLRYHALHHLFPAIPYHALGTAHRRLVAQLPADSPYRQTISSGLWATLAELWRDSGRAR